MYQTNKKLRGQKSRSGGMPRQTEADENVIVAWRPTDQIASVLNDSMAQKTKTAQATITGFVVRLSLFALCSAVTHTGITNLTGADLRGGIYIRASQANQATTLRHSNQTVVQPQCSVISYSVCTETVLSAPARVPVS